MCAHNRQKIIHVAFNTMRRSIVSYGIIVRVELHLCAPRLVAMSHQKQENNLFQNFLLNYIAQIFTAICYNR